MSIQLKLIKKGVGVRCYKNISLLVMLLGVISIPVLAQKDLKQAESYFAENQYQEALNHYLLLEVGGFKTSKRIEIMQNIAFCYLETNNAPKALEYYNAALEIDSVLSTPFRLSYARALIETAHYKKAQEYIINQSEDLFEEELLLRICEYALSHSESKENVRVRSVKNQQGDHVYGLMLFENGLLYTTSETKSNKIKTRSYIYSQSTGTNLEYDFDNNYLNSTSLFTPVLDTENNVLYFSRNISDHNSYYESNRDKLKIGIGGVNNLGIFSVNLDKGNKQSMPEYISFISYNYNTTHPFITPDGKTMYFASDVIGGYGSYDIYYSNKTESGWSSPINMGGKINTFMDEGYPVYKDGKLYFTSSGHPGYGGLDLFVYDIEKDTVSNLGKPANSSADDFYLIWIDDSRGFFMSNRGRDDGRDIIHFIESNSSF